VVGGVQCTQTTDSHSRLLLPARHTHDTPVLLAINGDDDTPGARLATAADRQLRGLDSDNRGESAVVAPAAAAAAADDDDDNSNDRRSGFCSSAVPHQRTQSQVAVFAVLSLVK